MASARKPFKPKTELPTKMCFVQLFLYYINGHYRVGCVSVVDIVVVSDEIEFLAFQWCANHGVHGTSINGSDIENDDKKNREKIINILLTCKLAISDRPARFHTILAGGFASASHRSTNESLPSSTSICGAPSNRIVGGSTGKMECVIKKMSKCGQKQHKRCSKNVSHSETLELRPSFHCKWPMWEFEYAWNVIDETDSRYSNHFG